MDSFAKDSTSMSQTSLLPVKRALLSVSDKTGLIELGRALVAQGAEILSTGGSAKSPA